MPYECIHNSLFNRILHRKWDWIKSLSAKGFDLPVVFGFYCQVLWTDSCESNSKRPLEPWFTFWMRWKDADAGAEWVNRLRGSPRKEGRCDELQPVESRWIFCVSPSPLLHRLIRLLLWRGPHPALLLHHRFFSVLLFSSLHLLLLLSFSPHWIPSPAVPLSLCPGLADRDPRVRPAGCGRHAAGQQGKTSLPARRATGRQMDSWRKREGGMMERVLSRSGGREGD